LVVDMVRNHDRAPSSWCDGGPLYPVWRAGELPARCWYTTLWVVRKFLDSSERPRVRFLIEMDITSRKGVLAMTTFLLGKRRVQICTSYRECPDLDRKNIISAQKNIKRIRLLSDKKREHRNSTRTSHIVENGSERTTHTWNDQRYVARCA
jgi:hypothetical protein